MQPQQHESTADAIQPRHYLTDEQILEVIEELYAKGDTVVTGTRVRMALGDKYSRRGGVGRVYALLQKSDRERSEIQRVHALKSDLTKKAGESETLTNTLAQLQSELASAKDTIGKLTSELNTAYERERAHQDYWAEKIYAERAQLQGLKHRAAEANRAYDAHLRVSKELLVARGRIADLETRLTKAGLPLPDKAD